MTATIRDRLIAALGREGWKHDPAHRTRKYHVMMPPLGGKWADTARYFLGPSGSLRYSSAGSSTASVPHEQTKKRLLS